MNYLLGTLAVAVVILFLFAKSIYTDNQELKNAQALIISSYETSIKNIEDKAKFDLDIERSKAPTIKASEKVKIEAIKRGEIEKVINNNNNDFFIVSF